jgi:phage FluMu gp28-like protein
MHLDELRREYARDPEGLAERLASTPGGPPALVQLLKGACDDDGQFWLKFVLTRDEADPVNSVKQFPLHLDYLQRLWDVFSTRNLVVVAKSRQMLVSWVVAAFAVHTARSRPHQAIYWQAQKSEDAVGMVCSPEGAQQARCQFIEANLPEWLRQTIKPVEGRLVYPNGSVIQALSGGADKIRGKTASLIVLDEFAHMQEQQQIYTSVAPLVQKGAKLIIVSTPNGSGNTFATLWHGRPVSAAVPSAQYA